MDKNSNYLTQAFKNTDLNYLSKKEMDKAYGPIVSQTFWTEVVKYRREHALSLPFRSIEGYPFSLTVTDTLKGKWDGMGERLNATIRSISSSLNEKERKELRKNLFFVSLKSLSTLEGAAISDLSLKAAINGTYGEKEEGHKSVLNYLSALDAYSEKSALSPSEDLLAESYMKALGVSELVSFYREAKGKPSIGQTGMFLRSQKGAPDGEIEYYLEPFFQFLKDDEEPTLVSLAAILFYLPYIAPFESHNEGVTLLFAKDLLAFKFAKESFFLPLERLLEPSKAFLEARHETIANRDLTYFVQYLLLSLASLLKEVEDAIKSAKIAIYAPEYNQLSEEEKEAVSEEALTQPLPPKNEQLTLDSFGGLNQEEQDLTAGTNEEETTKSSLVTPEEEKEAPKKEPKNALSPSRLISVEEMMEAKKERPTFGYEADILSEKEAKEYARYLLETNPNLNKKQALFLSTHCTEGRFYSIQQFKSFTHCVYETARTSMDKLAKEGYYEKLQVKNKFVYTPKKKGVN